MSIDWFWLAVGIQWSLGVFIILSVIFENEDAKHKVD